MKKILLLLLTLTACGAQSSGRYERGVAMNSYEIAGKLCITATYYERGIAMQCFDSKGDTK